MFAGGQKRWVVVGLACAAALALLLGLWWSPADPPAPPGARGPDDLREQTGWSLLALGGATEPGPATLRSNQPASASAPRAPADLWHALFVEGSLRGADLDGAWGAWNGHRLSPDKDLKRRFDQLLTTLGESNTDELRLLVEWLATRDLGAAGAQAVLQVWDSYMVLQRHPYEEPMDLTRPERWSLVLQERQLARRSTLGMAWADAFYREEEIALRERLDNGSNSATTSTGAGPYAAAAPAGTAPEAWHQQRVSALGQDAADRLQAEERSQAQWEQRLARARRVMAELSATPELSDSQRQSAKTAWLHQHFEGSERLRASALLGL